MSPNHPVSKPAVSERDTVEEHAKPSRFLHAAEDGIDAEIAAKRLHEINEDPEHLVSGKKLTDALDRLLQ